MLLCLFERVWESGQHAFRNRISVRLWYALTTNASGIGLRRIRWQMSHIMILMHTLM